MKILIFFMIGIYITACGGPASSANQSDTANSSAVPTSAEAADITVNIEGAKPGTAKLIGIFEGQNYLMDTATINSDGSIHIQKNKPIEQGLVFLLLPDNTTIQMLVGKDQTFTMNASMPDIAGSMQVEGSIDNQLLYETSRFEQAQRPQFNQITRKIQGLPITSPEYLELRKQQEKLLKDRQDYLEDLFEKHPNTFFTSFKRAGQNPVVGAVTDESGTFDARRYTYLYRKRFWEGVDFSDHRLLRTPVISNKLQRYIKELTPQNPDSIIKYANLLTDKVVDEKPYLKYFANWITLQYEPGKTQVMDAEAIYVNMIQRYFTYDRAFWSDSVEVHGLQLRAHEMAGSLMGHKGPNVEAFNPEGQRKALYDLKAPYIIVYMYTPGCEHCAEETPKLVRNYPAWKQQGVDVFGIGVGTTTEEWKAYIRQYNMPWVNVFDPTNQAIYGKYYVNMTPEVYILNPDRIIIGKNLKIHQVMEVINRDKAKRKS